MKKILIAFAALAFVLIATPAFSSEKKLVYTYNVYNNRDMLVSQGTIDQNSFKDFEIKIYREMGEWVQVFKNGKPIPPPHRAIPMVKDIRHVYDTFTIVYHEGGIPRLIEFCVNE